MVIQTHNPQYLTGASKILKKKKIIKELDLDEFC